MSTHESQTLPLEEGLKNSSRSLEPDETKTSQDSLQLEFLQPRSYQKELLAKALAQNIICYMETGSGKTLIAILLMKHLLEEVWSSRGVILEGKCVGDGLGVGKWNGAVGEKARAWHNCGVVRRVGGGLVWMRRAGMSDEQSVYSGLCACVWELT